jgi:hypothetical protein
LKFEICISRHSVLIYLTRLLIIISINHVEVRLEQHKPVKEKERQENKSVSTQTYELFSQGKKPVEVAIKLNVRDSGN